MKRRQSHVANTKGGAHKGDWHVSNSSMGMGDYYGSGIRAKLGSVRDSYTPAVNPVSKTQLKKPPKTLA